LEITEMLPCEAFEGRELTSMTIWCEPVSRDCSYSAVAQGSVRTCSFAGRTQTVSLEGDQFGSIVADPECWSARGLRNSSCFVGTLAGRLVRLGVGTHPVFLRVILPEMVPVAVLNCFLFGHLPDARSVVALDMRRVSVAGEWALPNEVNWVSLSGGAFLYALGWRDSVIELWRFEWPVMESCEVP